MYLRDLSARLIYVARGCPDARTHEAIVAICFELADKAHVIENPIHGPKAARLGPRWPREFELVAIRGQIRTMQGATRPGQRDKTITFYRISRRRQIDLHEERCWLTSVTRCRFFSRECDRERSIAGAAKTTTGNIAIHATSPDNSQCLKNPTRVGDGNWRCQRRSSLSAQPE